jgi:mannose-6-phosphate isomerase-like protein (cupin superfamily)
MKFTSNLNSDDLTFPYFSMGRPWGVYTNFCDNKLCTSKILLIDKGRGLSLQFHYKRDQLYILLDDGFKITDGNTIYENEKAGSVFGFPRGHVHRAEYFGDKARGKILDLAFGENDEEDICRILDSFSRTHGTSMMAKKIKDTSLDQIKIGLRVISLVTGNIGTIVEIDKNTIYGERNPSIGIDWDYKEKEEYPHSSNWWDVFDTVEIIMENKHE